MHLVNSYYFPKVWILFIKFVLLEVDHGIYSCSRLPYSFSSALKLWNNEVLVSKANVHLWGTSVMSLGSLLCYQIKNMWMACWSIVVNDNPDADYCCCHMVTLNNQIACSVATHLDRSNLFVQVTGTIDPRSDRAYNAWSFKDPVMLGGSCPF